MYLILLIFGRKLTQWAQDVYDPNKHRELLQMLSVNQDRYEFSTESHAFVSINDKAIGASSPTEARLIKAISDGSLHARITFRLPKRGHSTIDISCWAHSIDMDHDRLGQMTIFIKDIVTTSTEIHSRPSDSLCHASTRDTYIYILIDTAKNAK